MADQASSIMKSGGLSTMDKAKLAFVLLSGPLWVVASFFYCIFGENEPICIYPDRSGSAAVVRVNAKPDFIFGARVEDSAVCIQDGKEREPAYCSPGQNIPWKYTGFKTKGTRLRMFVNGVWFPFGQKNTPTEDTFIYKPYLDPKKTGGHIVYTYQKSNDYRRCKMTSDIVYADTDEKRATNFCRYVPKVIKDNTGQSMYKFTDYAVGIHLQEEDVENGKVSLNELNFELCAMERGYGVYVRFGEDDESPAYHAYNPLVYSYTEICKDGNCRKQFLTDVVSSKFIKTLIPFSLPFQTATPQAIKNKEALTLFNSPTDSSPILESKEASCVSGNDELLATALYTPPRAGQKIYVNFANVNYEEQDGEIEIMFAEGVEPDEEFQPRRLGLSFLSKIIYSVLSPLFGQRENVSIGEVEGFTTSEGGFLVDVRNNLISNSAVQAVKYLSIVLWFFMIGYSIVGESRTLQSVADDVLKGFPFYILVIWALNPESYVFFDDVIIPLYLQVLNGSSNLIMNLFSNFVSVFPDAKNPFDFLDMFVGELFSKTTLIRVSGMATNFVTMLLFVVILSPLITWGMMSFIAKIFKLVITFTLSTIQIGIMFLLFPICTVASIHPKTRPALTRLFDQMIDAIIDFVRNTLVTVLLVGIPIYFYDQVFNYVVCYKQLFSWAFDIFGFTLFDITINTWQMSSEPDVLKMLLYAAVFCLASKFIDTAQSVLESATSGLASGSEFGMGATAANKEFDWMNDVGNYVKAEFLSKMQNLKKKKAQSFIDRLERLDKQRQEAREINDDIERQIEAVKNGAPIDASFNVDPNTSKEEIDRIANEVRANEAKIREEIVKKLNKAANDMRATDANASKAIQNLRNNAKKQGFDLDQSDVLMHEAAVRNAQIKTLKNVSKMLNQSMKQINSSDMSSMEKSNLLSKLKNDKAQIAKLSKSIKNGSLRPTSLNVTDQYGNQTKVGDMRHVGRSGYGGYGSDGAVNRGGHGVGYSGAMDNRKNTVQNSDMYKASSFNDPPEQSGGSPLSILPKDAAEGGQEINPFALLKQDNDKKKTTSYDDSSNMEKTSPNKQSSAKDSSGATGPMAFQDPVMDSSGLDSSKPESSQSPSPQSPNADFVNTVSDSGNVGVSSGVLDSPVQNNDVNATPNNFSSPDLTSNDLGSPPQQSSGYDSGSLNQAVEDASSLAGQIKTPTKAGVKQDNGMPPSPDSPDYVAPDTTAELNRKREEEDEEEKKRREEEEAMAKLLQDMFNENSSR